MIIVCTTQDSDDPLVDVCKNYGVSLFRGSKNDLIHRFYSAINYFNLDMILQIDGDDPLTDTGYMNLCLENLIKNNCDVTICENLPLGIASKAFTKNAILKVKDYYVPGVNDTGYMYFFTKTNLCKIHIIKPTSKFHINNKIRLTLDYEEDLKLIKKNFKNFYKKNKIFSLSEILKFIDDNPNLYQINSHLNDEYWNRTENLMNLKYKNKTGNITSIKI